MSLRSCGATRAQDFRVPGADPVTAFGPIIQRNNSNQCLQTGSVINSSAVNLAFAGCQGSTTSQYWMVTPDGTIRNAVTGACLDNNGQVSTSGNRVTTFPCSTTSSAPNQTWDVTAEGWIVNPATGECLDSTAPTIAGNSPLPANYPGMSLAT